MNRKTMILLSAALMTVAVSCEEKEGKQEEEKLNVPELHADVEEVEIVALSDEKALELTWTAAAESGVNYMLQYGLEGSKETKAVSCGTEMSKTFTVKDLDAIRAELGVSEETDFKLSFLVEAKFSAVVLPVQSELLTVNVKYNIPVPEPLELYGIGDAFSWAWDRGSAEKMTTEDHIHFTWEGVIEAGEGKMFKFLTNESISNESWLPSYGRNAESENYWALALRTAESDGDTQFKVDKTGNYVLTVDIENMVMSAEFKGDGKQHFYGIGEPFAWAWTLSDAEEFSSVDQKTWTWTGDVKAGGFKIMLSRTDWSKGYNWNKAADNDTAPEGDVTEWTAFLRDENVSKDNDDYFKFPKEGNYTVTFVPESLKVTIKYNGKRSDWKPDTNYDMDGMYLYGPTWGWGLADVQAMTTTDNDTYIYKGNIKKGDGFKIMCKKDKWWPAFVPNAADASKMAYHKSKDEGDAYWGIAEDGYYTVTAVLSTLEISIVRNGDMQ